MRQGKISFSLTVHYFTESAALISRDHFFETYENCWIFYYYGEGMQKNFKFLSAWYVLPLISCYDFYRLMKILWTFLNYVIGNIQRKAKN